MFIKQTTHLDEHLTLEEAVMLISFTQLLNKLRSLVIDEQ